MKKLFVLMFVVLFAGYAGAQTRTALKTVSLKKDITDHIAKNYPGYTIKEAFKVEKNKMVTYEIKAQKDLTKITLVYDDKGTFLKTETPKPVTTNKGVSEQGTKTTPSTTPKTDTN
jgi:hypothetical protein